MIRKIWQHSFKVAGAAILLAAIYWGILASDRYVSEANVVINRTDFGNGGDTHDFAALITGGVRSPQDLMLLRDHMLSVDMLEKLNAKLNLRSHYSDRKRDILSRLWFEDASIEFFHRHYLSRVTIETDDLLASVLRISAHGYTPETAHAIATLLVEEGEKFMNDMYHSIAHEQVLFLEKQVAEKGEALKQARQVVLAFQNANELASPQGKVESLGAIVSRIDGQLSELKGKREAMLGYLSPKAPDIALINIEITALEKQLGLENARLASLEGQTLNRTLEEFQRLEMEAKFAQDVYQTALVALEKGRIDATRTLKKVSIVQSPTLPQYPVEPRRIYNIFLFALAALVMIGIMHLLAAIIRDHKD
jgi:capsular polysaccharide transport system permease protein